MFDRRLPAVAILGLLLLLARRHAEAQGGAALPEGTMQSKARAACTLCHDAAIIVQQRLTKEQWGKEVDKMAKWGALLNSDRDALIDYLSTNFSPEKPAYLAPRSRRTRKTTSKPHS